MEAQIDWTENRIILSGINIAKLYLFSIITTIKTLKKCSSIALATYLFPKQTYRSQLYPPLLRLLWIQWEARTIKRMWGWWKMLPSPPQQELHFTLICTHHHRLLRKNTPESQTNCVSPSCCNSRAVHSWAENRSQLPDGGHTGVKSPASGSKKSSSHWI